jgi:hypothetical protein
MWFPLFSLSVNIAGSERVHRSTGLVEQWFEPTLQVVSNLKVSQLIKKGALPGRMSRAVP